jgi:hypothetical protein
MASASAAAPPFDAAAASAAVASLSAAAAAGAPSFKPVVATLEAHAAAQPELGARSTAAVVVSFVGACMRERACCSV